MSEPALRFEGVIGFATADGEEAAHFFEHTLGLELAGEDGGIRMYQLGEGTTVMVDSSGGSAGDAPYLLFSTDDVTKAAEHFLERGCAVRELPWATGAGFLASTTEGHTVAVVAAEALGGD
jgi:predicted enzyme related to lactoylglutathione lyase